MDITSIVIGFVIAVLSGLGIISFIKNKSVRDIFKDNVDNIDESIDSVDVKENEIERPLEPSVSSKINLKKIGKTLLDIIGKSSIIIIAIITQVSPIENKQAIRKYIKMTEKYVLVTEQELDNIRYDQRKDTTWDVRIIENGNRIDVLVKVPIMQPLINNNGDVVMVKSQPIIRSITIDPKMKHINIKEGLYLYTGLLLGVTYNITDKKFNPLIGFEALTYYINSIAITTFPLITLDSWGIGGGIGPSNGLNLKGYINVTKQFSTSNISFGVGIAAIVLW